MQVTSSHIAEVDWHDLHQGGIGDLDVKFHTGRIYRYFKVPKGIYERMLSASSIGQYLDMYVKKAGYLYKDITEELDLKPQVPNELDRRINVAATKIMALIQLAATERGVDKFFHFADEYFSVEKISEVIEKSLFPDR